MEDAQENFDPKPPVNPALAKAMAQNKRAIEAAMGASAKNTLAEATKALGAKSALADAAKAISGMGIAANVSEASKLGQTFRQASENITGITALSNQFERLQLDLSHITIPTHQPVEMPDMSEVFAAKAKRDAERDAAVLATRDASVELAGGIRKLAAVEAEMLVQITRMAAGAAGTRRWTKLSVWVGIAVLLITAAALGIAVATYIYG